MQTIENKEQHHGKCKAEQAPQLRNPVIPVGQVVHHATAEAVIFYLFPIVREELLQKFLPKYIGVLTDKQFNDYISEIIIEGHTDTQGDYLYNLELSQKRALSVATFCLDENKKVLSTAKITKLRKIVTANGKSFSNPILDKDGKEDQNASRRVEFLFRLKDDEMINDISDILNN